MSGTELTPRVTLQDRVPATIHHLYGSGEVEGRGVGKTACGITTRNMMLAGDSDYDEGRPCKRCPWTPSTSFCGRCGRNQGYADLIGLGLPGAYQCRDGCKDDEA